MIDVDIEQRRGRFELAVRFSADAPVIGLFGPSGAGKSSVVDAIAGIGRPTRGLIRINETTLYDSARGIDVPPERRRVGYVFQDGLLFPHLAVEANLLYGLRRRSAAERFITPARVIDLLGLGALLHRTTRTLSGGEKQRVAIGRALLAQPRLLLMDEPLAALDDPRKAEILDYIERLRDELRIPIVYVSHSVPEIARLADTVVILAEGRSVTIGDARTVLGRAGGDGIPRVEPSFPPNPAPRTHSQEHATQIRARNRFCGTVRHVLKGPVSTEVTVSIAPGIEVASVISTGSADALGLEVGKSAHVLIKASSVLVGVD